MNLPELTDKIRLASLHPIAVGGSALEKDKRGLSFSGSLDEYFDAVRALNVSAIFISTQILEERWFWHTPESDGEDLGEEDDEIDFCSIKPELSQFKSHIGDIAVYKLSAMTDQCNLNFYISEDWWLKFKTLMSEAVNDFEERQAEVQAESKANQEKKDRDLFNAVDKLIDDENFVRLPTQRAMLMYALERIPGLETVDQFALKAELQNLHAKIKAKGLGRKH